MCTSPITYTCDCYQTDNAPIVCPVNMTFQLQAQHHHQPLPFFLRVILPLFALWCIGYTYVLRWVASLKLVYMCGWLRSVWIPAATCTNTATTYIQLELSRLPIWPHSSWPHSNHTLSLYLAWYLPHSNLQVSLYLIQDVCLIPTCKYLCTWYKIYLPSFQLASIFASDTRSVSLQLSVYLYLVQDLPPFQLPVSLYTILSYLQIGSTFIYLQHSTTQINTCLFLHAFSKSIFLQNVETGSYQMKVTKVLICLSGLCETMREFHPCLSQCQCCEHCIPWHSCVGWSRRWTNNGFIYM